MPGPEELLEHELKFRLPSEAAGAAAAALAGHFRPDPHHPEGTVISLYYDTPDLRHLREALDGAWRKSKFRVRGYDDEIGRFAERKDRIGTRRRKRRSPLARPRPFAQLLHEGEPAELRALLPPAALRPVFAVSYRRLRFVGEGGARLSLDTDIRALFVHPALAGAIGRGALAEAVVEWKGHEAPSLRLERLLAAFGARRSSFSKYALCSRSLGAA